jgi:hypothetical protein
MHMLLLLRPSLLLCCCRVDIHQAMAAGYARDLADRAQVVREADDESAAVCVPKETKEWAETGWWKCEGPQPHLIPGEQATLL